MSVTSPNAESNGNARTRLVAEGLRLFAEKGYERATTRDICEAAGVNVSAIRYYFGDKAGLYRAAFTEPMQGLDYNLTSENCARLPLAESLDLFFKDFLEPVKRGAEVRLAMKLRFREMVEPTGAWQDEIDTEIKPCHNALLGLLKQELGLAATDPDLHRLVFAIIGTAVFYYVGQDVIDAIATEALADADAVDGLAAQLTAYALGMVDVERQRRGLSRPEPK